jgi:hypothetical protein
LIDGVFVQNLGSCTPSDDLTRPLNFVPSLFIRITSLSGAIQFVPLPLTGNTIRIAERTRTFVAKSTWRRSPLLFSLAPPAEQTKTGIAQKCHFRVGFCRQPVLFSHGNLNKFRAHIVLAFALFLRRVSAQLVAAHRSNHPSNNA